MTTEARELYCYVIGTEPFMTEIDKVNMQSVAPLITIRQIVRRAIEKYYKDYCTPGVECFSSEDFQEVANKIYYEKRGIDMERFEEVVEVLVDNGIDNSDIFRPDEVEPRKSNNAMERLGTLVLGLEFVRSNTWYDEETYDDIDGNTSGERHGRFDIHDNYVIKETDYFIGAFVIWGDVACAEIWSRENDCVVAYIRM